MASKPKTKLTKLVVDEVSLVDRGANAKTFLLTKRAPTMSDTEKPAEVASDTTEPAPAEDVSKAAEVAAAAQAEVIAKAVNEAVAKAKAAAEAEVAAAKDAAAETVKKALEEKVALEKRLADAAEAAEVAEAVQKAATNFKNLPVKPDVLGRDLRAVRKADGALADRLETLLKAYDALALQATEPKGAAAAAETSATALDEINKRAKALVDAKQVQTFAEGVNKALSDDAELYKQYESEKKAKA